MRWEDSLLTDSTKQHNADGGSHTCLFCKQVYSCVSRHENPYGAVRDGGRCCLDCRNANLLSLQRHEMRRRKDLYG